MLKHRNKSTTVTPPLTQYTIYVISTLRKFLPVSANFKKSWKHILHPTGNKWRIQLGQQKYTDGTTP